MIGVYVMHKRLEAFRDALLATLSFAAVAALAVPSATAQTSPADSLAAQVRTQGFTCTTPVSAKRDRKLSRPDRAAWVLHCGNANYRIKLDPDMAAAIEPLR